ncbi:cell division protein PerM [Jatrophihabitans sp. DSM 45814]
MAAEDDYPPGWLTQFRRGVVSGFVLLIVAVLIMTIPVSLAWLAPGADSTSAGHALKAAVLITVAGNHGGLVLDGTRVTLTPLLVTMLLAWLVLNQARRQETDNGFAGLVCGYTAANAIAAHWSALGTTRVEAGRSSLAACGFILVVGGAARYLPPRWHALSQRWRQVGVGALGITAVYAFAASLLAAGALAMHLHGAAHQQATLATGAGGLPVAFVGIAGIPNAVLSGVGYLAGPGFTVGSHTSISILSATHGPLPVFPLLAAVPSGGPAIWLGTTIGAATALAAGFVAARLVGHRLVDALFSALLAGFGVAVLCTLAGGSLGPGSLNHVGSIGWQVGSALAVLSATASSIWVGANALRQRSAPSAENGSSEPAPVEDRLTEVSPAEIVEVAKVAKMAQEAKVAKVAQVAQNAGSAQPSDAGDPAASARSDGEPRRLRSTG